MSGLIEILEEQAVFGFTGRVNIILKKNRQYLGVITQREGLLVDAQFKDLQGKKALFSVLISDLEKDELSYVVEPELVEEGEGALSLSIDLLKKEAAQYYEEYRASQKLRPPSELRLLIHPQFIVDGPGVTGDEFSLLATLTEYSRVGDLYEKSSLLEYEVTKCLVSLRKKGALRVFRG